MRAGAYTRYADDLVLSGGIAVDSAARTLVSAVSGIAQEEGFRLNPHKTRVQRAAERQTVTGIVVNARPNVARDDYDRLKATLHNAVRDGPASQNQGGHPDFRAHLLGRIAWVWAVNPERSRPCEPSSTASRGDPRRLALAAGPSADTVRLV